MKDVPKETLYSLMKYIYCGEVNVNREHLDEFISTAKSLKVKGLIDDQNPQFSQCQPMNLSFAAPEMASKPNIRGFQYQSTSASIRAQTPVNMSKISIPINPAPRFYDLQHDTKVDAHFSDEMYEEDQFDNDEKDLKSEPEPVRDGPGSENRIKRTAADTGAPKRKRVKRNDGKQDYFFN